MLIKTLLNKVERFKSFIYGDSKLMTVSSGAVEGLNLKAKLTVRKAYGFKTLRCLQVALYHTLGDLPEPLCHHRFC